MTRIWMSGLEAGSVTVFDTVASGAIVSVAQARTGTYSLSIPTVDDAATLDISAISELYMRFGLYPTGGTNDRTFLTLLDGTDEQLTFQLESGTNNLIVRRGDFNDTEIADGGAVIPNDGWVCVEVYVLIDDTEGILRVRVDGVSVIGIAGADTQATLNSTVDAIQFGAAPGDGTSIMYGFVDDIEVNDTNGTVNNSWIGQGGIFGLRPDSAGRYQQLTPNVGTNPNAVDDPIPDEDVTYVASTSGVDEQDTYVTEDLPVPTSGFSYRVDAVQWLCRARNTAGGLNGVAELVRIGAADDEGVEQALTTSYAYKKVIMETDPIFSQQWLHLRVNAAEYGAVLK